MQKYQGAAQTASGSSSSASPLSCGVRNRHYAVVTFEIPAIGYYIDGVPVATKSATARPNRGGEEPISIELIRNVSTTISSYKQVAILDVKESAADSNLVFKLSY